MLSSNNLSARSLPFFAVALVALCFSYGNARAYADSPDEHLLDQQGIEELEAKALNADPREQCFLFAQLVHQLTEQSAQKYADGDTEKAIAGLKKIQNFAMKINMRLTEHDKRLKNAEILLRHTAFRLREMLHSSNAEDQPLVLETLAQIDHLESDALQQVFKK